MNKLEDEKESHEHKLEKPELDNEPKVWEVFWGIIPERARKPLLIVVALTLCLAFLLSNVIKPLQDVVRSRTEPTPTLLVEASDMEAIHVAYEFESLPGCVHDGYVLPLSKINEVEASEYHGNDEFEEARSVLGRLKVLGNPLNPIVAWFNISQEKKGKYDDLLITSAILKVENYEPFTEESALIPVMKTCASQLLPNNHLGSLHITPTQRSYDVLSPRVTSPYKDGVQLTEPMGSPRGIGLYINATEAGIYSMSLEVAYEINGYQYVLEPMNFSMAVPDPAYIQEMYYFSLIDSGLSGPEDPSEYIEELREIQSTFLEFKYYQNVESIRGLEGSYMYIVNMGRETELTDWLITKDSAVLYRFPHYELDSGSGVRVWVGEGNDTNIDLFGSESFSGSDAPTTIELRNSSRDIVARCYVP